ncbi:hypothetical protein M501DRAFT_996179 [Patellaria atrata CBS 101060]|uniref:Uncharacterized protein n=1 Tax=Patellaria atrata CBS 101060 TaxID=1346257 RepID=A0A9P4S6H2_9PEZI|nr:hypothetical protein M501DRAFT_996179 [Patellaria atrata CBS 101060]
MTDNKAKLAFSDREMQLLAYAWQCFDAPVKIDHEKLAQLSGYKNAETSRVIFNGLKRKLATATGNTTNGNGSTGTNYTPKSTFKRTKRTKSANAWADTASGDDDDELDATPKAGKKRKAVSVKTPAPKKAKNEVTTSVPSSPFGDPEDVAKFKTEPDVDEDFINAFGFVNEEEEGI